MSSRGGPRLEPCGAPFLIWFSQMWIPIREWSLFLEMERRYCCVDEYCYWILPYLPLVTDPKCGEGIYFAGTVKKALELWKENHEEFLYFVEAEVLTGKSAFGKPGLILPPPIGQDPNDTYDSVAGGPDVAVIFSGYQALPRYIIICRKVTSVWHLNSLSLLKQTWFGGRIHDEKQSDLKKKKAFV